MLAAVLRTVRLVAGLAIILAVAGSPGRNELEAEESGGTCAASATSHCVNNGQDLSGKYCTDEPACTTCCVEDGTCASKNGRLDTAQAECPA